MKITGTICIALGIVTLTYVSLLYLGTGIEEIFLPSEPGKLGVLGLSMIPIGFCLIKYA